MLIHWDVDSILPLIVLSMRECICYADTVIDTYVHNHKQTMYVRTYVYAGAYETSVHHERLLIEFVQYAT